MNTGLTNTLTFLQVDKLNMSREGVEKICVRWDKNVEKYDQSINKQHWALLIVRSYYSV